MAQIEVVAAPDRERYEILVDGTLAGFADAIPRNGRILLPHVEIAPPYRGRGLSMELVRGMLDDLRDKATPIDARCPVVLAFLRRYPAYRDLQA